MPSFYILNIWYYFIHIPFHQKAGQNLKTVREQVTIKLRDELVAGQHEGGKVLRENDLAERLGVSRGPIRDAILQLASEGFLAYQANRGVTVKHPPNPRNRRFIVSLRTQIEEFAIQTGLESITDEAIQEIESALGELKKACGSDDGAKVARCDSAFHESILISCGGEDFVNAWRQLCAKMLMQYSRLDNFQDVYGEHLRIFKAVRARDAQKAIEAIKSNLQ
ncbi:MAG: GntR family transcriptional regulator [Planctomycetota bacterium]